jgi:hypothetical protein
MGEDGRFDVAVSFDERRGYVGSSPQLRQPVVALSVASLVLPWRSGGKAPGGESPMRLDDLGTLTTSGCFAP